MHRLAWRSRIRHEGAELKELRAATQRRDERGPERVQKLPQRLAALECLLLECLLAYSLTHMHSTYPTYQI